MKELLKKIEIILLGIFFMGLFHPAFAQEMIHHRPGGSAGEIAEGQQNPPSQASIGSPGEGNKELAQTTSPPITSIIEIKRLDTIEPLYSFEIRNAEIVELFRLLAHQYNLNLIIDNKVQGKITAASFNRVTLEEGIDGIAEICNLELKKNGNFVKLSPHLITKTITLKYLEAKSLLEKDKGKSGTESGGCATEGSATAQSGEAGASASSGETAKSQNTIFDLLSQDGKILLGKQPNTLMIIDYTENVEKIENYIQMVDQRMLSKVFKLEYLNAQDILGEAQASTSDVGAGSGQGGTSASSTSGSITSY